MLLTILTPLCSPLAQPLMITFYLLTVVCTVSVCDRSECNAMISKIACISFRHCRYDIAEFSLSQLHRAVTLQSGALAVLVYWATLLLRYRLHTTSSSNFLLMRCTAA